MKDMKLGTKEIKLILYLGGVILALLVYEFFFTPRMDSISKVKTANETLTKQLTVLQDEASNEQQYKTDTAKYQSEMTTTLAKFPADVKPENAILYARDMQTALEMPIKTVNVSDSLLMYTFGQGSESSSSSTTTATDTTDTADTTETDAATAASGGASATATANGSTGASTAANAWNGNVMLYKTPVSLSYTIAYGNLKRMVNYIYSASERCSIDTVSLSYDTSTGNIVGTMDVGMYYITGAGTTYTSPIIDGVQTGQSNLFGTVK